MSCKHENIWTTEELSELVKLCSASECWSALDIAGLLNQKFAHPLRYFTRNSVIGKISRNNIPWNNRLKLIQNKANRGERVFSGENVNYNPQRKQQNSLINKIKQKSTKFHPTHGLVGDAIYAGVGIPRLTARDNQCSWPFGKCPTEGHLVCGKPTMEKFSYCSCHMTIGYKTIPKKRSISSHVPSVERIG